MRSTRKILEPHATTVAKGYARLTHAPEKLRMILNPVLKPVIVRLEPNEHARRLTVARDNNLTRGRETQIAR